MTTTTEDRRLKLPWWVAGDTNAKTDKAVENPNRTPDAANAQKDVTKKTDDLRNTPLPVAARIA